MLNVPKSNVIDVCRKFSDTGSVNNKPRSGRPKKNQAPRLSAVGKDRKNKSSKFAVRYFYQILIGKT